MGMPLGKLRFSFDDHMAWETEQAEHHEYLNGKVFAMTGACDAHNTIASNLQLPRLRYQRDNTVCKSPATCGTCSRPASCADFRTCSLRYA